MALSNLANLPLPLLILLGLLGYAVVTQTLYVLAHRSHMRTRRHDLLVNIKTKRLEYERQLYERQKALMADYDVVDDADPDGPEVVGRIDGTDDHRPAEARRAA